MVSDWAIGFIIFYVIMSYLKTAVALVVMTAAISLIYPIKGLYKSRGEAGKVLGLSFVAFLISLHI